MRSYPSLWDGVRNVVTQECPVIPFLTYCIILSICQLLSTSKSDVFWKSVVICQFVMTFHSFMHVVIHVKVILLTAHGGLVGFAAMGTVLAALFTLEPAVPGIVVFGVMLFALNYEEVMRSLIGTYANNITPYGRKTWEIFPATFGGESEIVLV